MNASRETSLITRNDKRSVEYMQRSNRVLKYGLHDLDKAEKKSTRELDRQVKLRQKEWEDINRKATMLKSVVENKDESKITTKKERKRAKKEKADPYPTRLLPQSVKTELDGLSSKPQTSPKSGNLNGSEAKHDEQMNHISSISEKNTKIINHKPDEIAIIRISSLDGDNSPLKHGIPSETALPGGENPLKHDANAYLIDEDLNDHSIINANQMPAIPLPRAPYRLRSSSFPSGSNPQNVHIDSRELTDLEKRISKLSSHDFKEENSK